MSGAFTAIGLGAAAGLAGSLGSAAMGSSAAGSGARKAQNAALWGWNTGAPYYDQSRADMQPYVDAGSAALWQIRNNMGLNPGQAPGSGMWQQPNNLRTAAQAAGVDYNDIIHQINSGDLKRLMGVTPAEAFGGVSRGDIRDFSGINVQRALQGYSPQDVQGLAGVSLKGLMSGVGSEGIPNFRRQPQQPQAQSGGGLNTKQQANFDRLHALAQAGTMNDKQQANYIRLLNLMQGGG